MYRACHALCDVRRVIFVLSHDVWYNFIFSITIFYTSVAISFNRFYALPKTVIIGRMKEECAGVINGICEV